MKNSILEDKIPDDILSTSTDRNVLEEINDLIEKNIGVNRWKFLRNEGAIIVKSAVNLPIGFFNDYSSPRNCYDIITKKGEYITLLNLSNKHQKIVKYLYKHRIGKLMNFRTAIGLPLTEIYSKSINPVNVGYSEKEKAWYGIDYNSKLPIKAYIGCVLNDKTGEKAKTDEDCKLAVVRYVIAMMNATKTIGTRGQ